MKISSARIKMRQAMPLDVKIKYSEARIRQWYKHFDGDVYVSFSGGKDSTVLLHLVRNIFPDVVAVFFDTGLEFPEIRNFVKTIDNVSWINPKHSFKKIIEKYGYPVVSKEIANRINAFRKTKDKKIKKKLLHGNEKGYFKISEKWKYLIDAPFKISDRCCYYMKKAPANKYKKKTGNHPIIGTMVSESSNRLTSYMKTGCNNFNGKNPKSRPLSFWKESDIWDYIKLNNLDYSTIYDKGYDRTGCMFCMFGLQFEKTDLFSKNRFQKMKETHPSQYKYCIDNLQIGKVLDYMDIWYR